MMAWQPNRETPDEIDGRRRWPEALRYLQLVLPSGWEQIQWSPDGGAFQHRSGLRVVVSGAIERDGKRWLHVSCSRRDRVPSWDDLKLVKEVFLGNDRLAVQVLPRAEEYVNIHPYVLHLWCCVDGDPVPDFRYRDASGLVGV